MGRTVEYIGGPRQEVSPAAVAIAWRKVSDTIPVQSALGAAEKETNYAINEMDTEVSGFVSKGIFQISDEEAASVGFAHANLYDLDEASAVFAVLQKGRLDDILAAAGKTLDQVTPDIWAYLSIAHNQGAKAALTTVRQYGIDWDAYKARNNAAHPEWGRYGDAYLSGGAKWNPLYAIANVPNVLAVGALGVVTFAFLLVLLNVV